MSLVSVSENAVSKYPGMLDRYVIFEIFFCFQALNYFVFHIT